MCMSICNAKIGVGNYYSTVTGCESTAESADIVLKKHDLKPEVRLSVVDCDGAVELSDNLTVRFKMWVSCRLKTTISATDSTFALADNVGFDQIAVGDSIFLDHPRQPEQMTITGFDEAAKTIHVLRAQAGTSANAFAKGSSLKIMRISTGVGFVDVKREKQLSEEGIQQDILVSTELVYNWNYCDTDFSGRYEAEFILIHEGDRIQALPRERNLVIDVL